MSNLCNDQITQMMGIGYIGEVRQGPDGNLYQYVQGVDGLGNPIGFWRMFKRLARRVVRKALPIARQFAPIIPGGAAALTAVTPFLKRAGVAGYEGIGALYEAPDGSLYQVHGIGEDYELNDPGEDEISQLLGTGYLGEVRQGPDGNLYQFVQGIDGLGNPIGFWRMFKRLARRVVRKALPIARQFAPFIPGGTAALTAATPFLRRAGIAGEDGLGDLYQAQDGSVYQMQGLADEDDLQGPHQDEELRGAEEEEELRGFAEDDELQGLEEDEELQGYAGNGELREMETNQEIQGFDGYLRRNSMNGLDRFEPEQPPQTRWHSTSTLQPEVWKPLW